LPQGTAATFGVVELINSGEHIAAVWKQRAEGTTLWAVRGGGTSRAGLYGVVVDSAGGVLAAGKFNTSPSTFGGVTLTTAGDGNDAGDGPDAVLWKMDTDGITLWAVGGGGTGYSDNLYGVAEDGTDAVDSAGAVVAAGSFDSSTATVGGVALTNAAVPTPRCSYDAGLWKASAERSAHHIVGRARGRHGRRLPASCGRGRHECCGGRGTLVY